jgi:hypothetical protein
VTLEGRAASPPGSFGSTRLHTVAASGRTGWFILWMMAGGLAFGCNRDTKGAGAVGYGDPVGIELTGRPPAPPLSIAFAVTRDRDARPTVPSLASAIEAAARQCPDFTGAIVRGETVRFELRATQTAVQARNLSAERGGPCVKSVVEGQAFAFDGAEPVDMVVEVRLGLNDASTLR